MLLKNYSKPSCFLRIKYSLKSSQVLSQITEQIHDSEIGDILEKSLHGKRTEYDDYIRQLDSDNVFLMGLVAGVLVNKKFGRKICDKNKA